MSRGGGYRSSRLCEGPPRQRTNIRSPGRRPSMPPHCPVKIIVVHTGSTIAGHFAAPCLRTISPHHVSAPQGPRGDPMSVLSIIDEGVHRVAGAAKGGRLLADPASFATELGWELKAEGLCRGDVCVPVPDPDLLTVAKRLD